MSFDPDAYLAGRKQSAPFDPDAYLGIERHEQGAVTDATKRVGRSLVDQPGSIVQALGTIMDLPRRASDAFRDYVLPVRSEEDAQRREELKKAEREQFGDPAGMTQDTGRQMRKDAGELYTGQFAPDKTRDDKLLAKVADSTGPLATAIATPGGLVAKTASGAMLNSQGAADEAEKIMLARGASEEDARAEAARQFVLNLPAGALESVAWGRLLGRYGHALEEAVAERFGKDALRRILRATGEQAVIEGGEEAVQQIAQNAAAKATFDPERQLSTGVKDAATIGAIMGGGMGGSLQSVAEGAAKLSDTGANVPESRASLALQQQQLERGERVAQMFPKGTSELDLPEGMQRVETPRGVFHFDPQQITAEQIQTISGAGKENLILGLGKFDKAEVMRRAAAGEPLATVTERAPDGTEARSAVVTPSTIENTRATMEAGKTPGHTVATESLVDTLRRRGETESAEAAATRAKEEQARAERFEENKARRERFDETLQRARETYRDRASADFAAIEGALNAVKFYAEDNSVGLMPEQRDAARQATAALQKAVDERAPTEQAKRDAEKTARAAAAAAEEQARAERIKNERQSLQQRERTIRRTGIDPTTQERIYDKAPDDVVAEWASAGDKRAEREMVQRSERENTDTNGDDLLTVLKRVKLPASDPTLRAELEQLKTEGVNFGDRQQLFDTKPGSLDSVAETLRTEYGFSQIQTPADVVEFAQRALRGEVIMPDWRENAQPRFARETQQNRLAPVSDAEVQERWNSLRTAFPEIEREWQFVHGEVQDVLERNGYTGDVPADVQAAVLPPELLSQWQRKRAERGMIVFATRMLAQPGKSTRLMLHELAHQYWDTLPGETREALRELYMRETNERTGPLFDAKGEPITDISFLPEDFTAEEIEADPDLPLREWFAERLALVNAEWANGRVRSRDTLMSRVAFELRELLQRVQRWVAQAQGRRVETALLEREFRRFLRQGARHLDTKGQAVALSYARAEPEFARGKKPARAADVVQQEIDAVRAELDSLKNSNEPAAEIERRGAQLTKKEAGLRKELNRAQRDDHVAASIKPPADPDVQRIPEGQPLAGAVIVPSIKPMDRQAALRGELERGRQLQQQGEETGNIEAKQEGARLVRLATERLNDEFPSWETTPASSLRAEPGTTTATATPAPAAVSQREQELADQLHNWELHEREGETAGAADMVRELRGQLDKEFPGWEPRDKARRADERRAKQLAYLDEARRAGDAQEVAKWEAVLDRDQPGWRGENATETVREEPSEPANEAQPGDNERDPFTPEPEPIDDTHTAAKRAELEGQSTTDADWLTGTWQKMRDAIRSFRGAIPELPTFPWSTLAQSNDPHLKANPSFYGRLKLGLRLLRSSNEYVQRSAEEAVASVVRPLLAAGRGKFDANAYQQLRSRQEQIRKLRENKKEVPPGVEAEVRALQSKLAESPMMLFQRAVLYLDLDWRARNLKDDEGNPITLPMGLTQRETGKILDEISGQIAASPHRATIEEALKRHIEMVSSVAADLKDRGLLAPEHLANPYYFPHVVIGDIAPSLAEVKESTNADFRGYLITPVGSRKAIETDYVRAMYYHLVQVFAHNQRADIVRDYFQRYDIMERVRDRAKQLSRQWGRHVSWRTAFHAEFSKQGYEIYGADEADMFPTLQINRDVLASRLGVPLTSEDIGKQLDKLGLEGIRLLPGDIEEASRAGEKEYWILPDTVAKALRKIAQRAEKSPGPVERAMAGVQGLWKRWILYAPHNYIRYEYGNTLADLEKLFSADPAVFGQLSASAREIRAFYDGGAASADLQQALKLGVMQSVTASELQALPELRAFEELQTDRQKMTRQTLSRLSTILFQAPLATAGATKKAYDFVRGQESTTDWQLGLGDRSTLRLSQMRESVFRYAKFKADLARIRNNASPVYAGAFWRDVEAIEDSKPGAGDAPYLKAAMISRSTFGDYGDISVGGQTVRQLAIPFYSWMEINFRYHANLFRNYRDAIAAGEISQGEALAAGGRAAAVLASGLTRRAAAAFLFRLALPYAVVQLWNSVMHADIEDELSEEDRRRFHLNVGRTADGRPLVIYTPTAFADVMKWFGGPEFARLSIDYVRGRTDLGTAFGEWRDRLVPDFLNNTLGSVGPLYKVPYTLLSKKSAFPDVTDQRTVPAYDMQRVIIGQMTDQFTADLIMRATNKDYYASRDMKDWARQLILQARVRDPEQWAFYSVKDKAAEFVQQRTGKSRENNYDAPDQEVLRNFRRAVFRGDVENATRFYLRLLQFGYTSERFAQSIRAQDPLAEVPRELRREFLTTLSDWEKDELLKRAYRYYTRISDARGQERLLFPRDRWGQAGADLYQRNPQTDRLRQIVENRELLPEDQLDATAILELRRSLAKPARRPSPPRPSVPR